GSSTRQLDAIAHESGRTRQNRKDVFAVLLANRHRDILKLKRRRRAAFIMPDDPCIIQTDIPLLRQPMHESVAFSMTVFGSFAWSDVITHKKNAILHVTFQGHCQAVSLQNEKLWLAAEKTGPREHDVQSGNLQQRAAVCIS